MRSSTTSKLSLVAACVAVGLAAQAVAAVSAPYTDDFSVQPGTVGSNLSVAYDRGTTSTWTPIAGGGVEHHFVDNSWGVCTAGVYANVSNLGGSTNKDFTVSADFRSTGGRPYAGATGLFAISSAGTNLGGWVSSTYYAGQIGLTGGNVSLSLIRNHPSNYPTGLASISFGALNLNTSYAMTLAGQYEADGLTLAFTVTEAGNPAFTPVTVTHKVLTADMPVLGANFGIRDYIQAGDVTVQYSNFRVAEGVAVPEPATLGLLGVAAVGLMARRRK